MTVELRIRVEDADLLKDLQSWLDEPAGVTTTPVPRPAEAHSQGTVWDFLSVACATGGPLAAALRALQVWLEARVTEIEVEVGEARFKVTSSQAATILPEIEKAARALNSAAGGGDQRG